MTATTITLYVKTLADAVGADQSELDAALPGYIERLTLALPDGVVAVPMCVDVLELETGQIALMLYEGM